MSKQCSLGNGEFYIDKIQKAIILTILLPSSAMRSSPQSRPNPPIYWKAADSLGIVPAHCNRD